MTLSFDRIVSVGVGLNTSFNKTMGTALSDVVFEARVVNFYIFGCLKITIKGNLQSFMRLPNVIRSIVYGPNLLKICGGQQKRNSFRLSYFFFHFYFMSHHILF